MSDREVNAWEKQEIIHSLAEATMRGGRSLRNVPGLLARIINEELWKDRFVDGELVRYEDHQFKEFVEAHYPVGLDTTISTLERLCDKEPEILDFLAKAQTGKIGRPAGSLNVSKNNIDSNGNAIDEDTTDIIRSKSKRPKYPSDETSGTSKAAAFNRLRSAAATDPKAAEYYQQALEGKIKPNAAMLLAGLREKRVAVSTTDMASTFKTLQKHIGAERLDELIEMFNEYKNNGVTP